MSTTITATDGDSLCSIAHQNGFGDCTPLRDDPANDFIVNRATDPAQVNPGDTVTIPDHEEGEEDGATEVEHEFELRGRLAFVRLVHGSTNRSVADDDSLTNLNISNYRSNRAGRPDGNRNFPGDSVRRFNANAHRDEDAFKVEALDIRGAGNLNAEIEALRPTYNAAGVVTGHQPFPTPRTLAVVLEQQGSTQRFRSSYLRLVTDDQDKTAIDTQSLLVSDLYDGGDKKVEILDQLVKATYEIPSCPNTPKCKSRVTVPVGTDRRRLRMNVHIMNNSVGSGPVVSPDDAERRILVWLRRIYAQMSIAPKLVDSIAEVDPPANLVSISNDTGLRARGDGDITFTIDATGGITSQVITVTPNPRDTPITTANALAALVAAPFVATVTDNPARFDHNPRRRSADIVLTSTGGERVTVSAEDSDDARQTVEVGRPTAVNFQEWGDDNWLVGSIEMRSMLKNYDTGDDRFDLFIVDSFIDPNLLGAAMMSGHLVDPRRSAISQVKWSAFVELRSSAAGDGFPTVIAHEGMHVVGEVMHAQNARRQLMHPTAPPNHNVDVAKRVRDGAVRYDGGRIRGFHNLVERMRTQGAPLLEGW